ncbi:hypothetical protein [Pedobacter sp. L105]|uniref:hypothetical protein n=1 Tax=Pedobacter sp. L105 TaxID=1641871 RepID=UPI00131DFEED|nr:hypothetical protein [Pedobacter sp. L105]
MRKSSDLDLVVLVEDVLLNNPQDFLAHFLISHVEYNGEEINFPMDIQVYTISSFRKEMYYGSLTRVFAVLNAFQIIYAEDDCAKQIINDADQRLNNTIQFVINDIARLDIPQVMKNTEAYFNYAHLIILEEKIQQNSLLIYLQFSEYVKELLIQFQYVLFADDLQKNINSENMHVAVKNMTIFRNTDGTRLLNFNKYFVDQRVIKLLDDINKVLKNNQKVIVERFDLVFDIINDAFFTYTNYAIARKIERYKYFRILKFDL